MKSRCVLILLDDYGQPQIVGGEIVHESEPSPTETGLLDANGFPIYRRPKQHPLGFDLTPRAAKEQIS